MDYKKEARKQYVKYFLVWFIIIGILAAIAISVIGMHSIVNNRPRGNTSAPKERVYDYADVLTDDEEERLRSQIEQAEKRLRMDIVIVTIAQPMEGEEAMRKNDAISPELEDVMEAYADNFWDDNNYGYNKRFEGDGVILVLNWYDGQRYIQLSSSGRAEDELSAYAIDNLTGVFARYYETDIYRAFSETTNALETRLDPRGTAPFPWLFVIVVPIVVALIYAVVNSTQKKTKDTTTANTYVPDGMPTMNNQRDEFIRKSVTQRRIQTSSSGGSGGSHHSGGGGHHYSRSGASHGGGGRRLR